MTEQPILFAFRQVAGTLPWGKGPGQIPRHRSEMGGVDESVAKEAFRLAAYKLPIATKFVSREAEI